MLAVMDAQSTLFCTFLMHASEHIRTTVVDTPYRGGVLCLMWWIRHTEAGYYANVVGYYAPPLYGVSTTSSIIPHHVSIIPGVSTTVVRIGSLACYGFGIIHASPFLDVTEPH